MSLNASHDKIHAGGIFVIFFSCPHGLKRGDVLSRLFFNFPLKGIIKKVEGKQDDLEVNGTHQPLL
jgi:hypothetical protein